MNKNILIIGNGFDLDLGMKTKYSDFANNEKYWPRDYGAEISGLQVYLETKRDMERWFDLENELRNYSVWEKELYQQVASMDPNKDMKYFENICKNLTAYLTTQEMVPLKSNSVAAKVINVIYNNGFFNSCYTFNYTDLDRIIQKLHIGEHFNCTHIHGSIKENSIVLGVDETKLYPGYETLKKVRRPHYEPNDLFNDLNNSIEIVFFGMSFGRVDNDYFKTFFESITSQNNSTNRKQRLTTIFTYDEKSKQSILNNISNLDIRCTDLYQSGISFIRTNNNMDSQKLDDFCNRLEHHSVSSREKNNQNILTILSDL